MKGSNLQPQSFLLYLLTYLLHGAVILEKLTGCQLAKKFPTLYRTQRFITAFTCDRHLSLSWASSIQSIPHPTYWRSILILLSPLHLGLASGLFPSRFLTKDLHMPLLSPYVLHSPPISFFLIWSPEKYRVSSANHSAPQFVVYCTPLLPRSSQAQISSKSFPGWTRTMPYNELRRPISRLLQEGEVFWMSRGFARLSFW
jgi:hypothetical protein